MCLSHAARGGWNGVTHEAASSLSLLCGDASDSLSNLCLFDPPTEGPAEERVLQAPVLVQILRAMAVEDKGTLVILTPERLTASNPAHVELARDISERLARAGLLTPLRPWNE